MHNYSFVLDHCILFILKEINHTITYNTYNNEIRLCWTIVFCSSLRKLIIRLLIIMNLQLTCQKAKRLSPNVGLNLLWHEWVNTNALFTIGIDNHTKLTLITMKYKQVCTRRLMQPNPRHQKFWDIITVESVLVQSHRTTSHSWILRTPKSTMTHMGKLETVVLILA